MVEQNLQDKGSENLIDNLRLKQAGKGYGAEGTCQEGNRVFAIVNFNIPMDSVPSVIISNVQLTNCSNPSVWLVSSTAFAVEATVTADGEAYFAFDWSAQV